MVPSIQLIITIIIWHFLNRAQSTLDNQYWYHEPGLG